MVSVEVKGFTRWNQVSVEETNTSEPLINCRKRRNAIKTRGESLTWDKSGGNLITARMVAGM